MNAPPQNGDSTSSELVEAAGFLHLRSSGVSLVLDLSGDTLPCVIHWGQDLGDLDPADLAALALVSVPPVTSNTLD
jgi:alpha-galactosidase